MVCSHDDCDQDAVAKGLCSKHYQQSRRPPPGKRGPAPKYDRRDSSGGAPRLQVRLEPELLDWVQQAHGGSAWIRDVVRQLHVKGAVLATDQAEFHRRVQKVVSGAIREVKAMHGDVADHAGSVGKRVAAQLWADMAMPDQVQGGQ